MIKNKIIINIIMLTALISCASYKPMTAQEISDPNENWNRNVFAFNMALDDYVLKPVSYSYKESVPGTIKLLVRNELDYISTPVSLINSILQGDMTATGHIISRFFINTTLGGLGLLDPASELGFSPHKEDFGQTLAVWGVPDGGYHMMPILGPGTLRGIAGRIAGIGMNPTTYLEHYEFYMSATENVIDFIDFRAQNYQTIEDLKNSSDDYYATVRSIFTQTRISAIENKNLNPEPEFIDFDDE